MSVKSKVEITPEEPKLNPNEESVLLIQNILRAKSPPASAGFKSKIKRIEQIQGQTQTALKFRENEKEVSQVTVSKTKTAE